MLLGHASSLPGLLPTDLGHVHGVTSFTVLIPLAYTPTASQFRRLDGVGTVFTPVRRDQHIRVGDVEAEDASEARRIVADVLTAEPTTLA